VDIKELQSFCMVGRLRSFSKASQALGIGQPAVTKHIHRIEAEVGKTLIERGTRPTQLTPAGLELFRLSTPLIEGLIRFTQTERQQAAIPPVVIACTHGFMNELLLRSVQSFRIVEPHQPVRIKLGTKQDVVSMVASGVADFGIAPSPDRLKALNFSPLVASERVLITPRDHELLRQPLTSLAEIARYPLILLGYMTQTRLLIEEAFKEHGASYEVAVELDSMDMVKRYVELGLGIGIGHKIALDAEDSVNLGIISLSGFLPSELVGVTTSRSRPVPEAAAKLIEHMKLKLKKTAKPAEPENIRPTRAARKGRR
jgi:DNA-binding transcriptional LysR family regulator